MWRWTRRILLTLILIVIAAAVSGATYQWLATRRELAATPPPGRLVDVGGHRLHLWCSGSGAPAVILDSGLGGTSADWGFVQAGAATFTQVCSYDRAGMGYSDAGPSPRTARRIASEVATLLDRGGVAGPVIAVGASIGGLNMRLFAADHEPRTAALVLVDASHENQNDDPPAIAPFVPLLSTIGAFRLLGISFGVDPDSLAPAVQPFVRATRFRASGYQAAANEFTHLAESTAEVRASRRRLRVPVVVITGARGNHGDWATQQRDQLNLADRSCQIVADRSGHLVPVQQPDAIVEALRALVHHVRSGGAGSPCAVART